MHPFGAARPSLLSAVLRRVCEEIGSTEPSHVIELDAGDDVAVDAAEGREMVALVAQAAQLMLARWAGAGRLSLTTVVLPERIEIEIADDGSPPASLAVARAGSADWTAVEGRLQALGGQAELGRCPQGGQALTLCLPRRVRWRRAA